jgi:hypothetical protein
LAWYSVAQTASDTNAITAMRIIFPNASRFLINGYLSLQKSPAINVNAPLTAQLSMSAVADPVRYST